MLLSELTYYRSEFPKDVWDSLGEHGEDMSDRVQRYGGSRAVLHRPNPALVQEVAGQRRHGGGRRPAGSHAERGAHDGRLSERLHV